MSCISDSFELLLHTCSRHFALNGELFFALYYSSAGYWTRKRPTSSKHRLYRSTLASGSTASLCCKIHLSNHIRVTALQLWYYSTPAIRLLHLDARLTASRTRLLSSDPNDTASSTDLHNPYARVMSSVTRLPSSDACGTKLMTCLLNSNTHGLTSVARFLSSGGRCRTSVIRLLSLNARGATPRKVEIS